MPRPKPIFSDLANQYLTGLSYDIPDLTTFNCNTQISFHCTKGHIYKFSITEIRRGDDPKSCPHCKNETLYDNERIPKKLFQDWGDKNNLTVISEKDLYKRWSDEITFECTKCKEHLTIKSLYHFETKTQFASYDCPGCKKTKLIDVDMIQKLEETKKTYNIIPVIPTLESEVTSEFQSKLSSNDWNIVKFSGSRKMGTFQCLRCGLIKECLPNNLFGKIGSPGRGCKQCLHIESTARINDQLVKLCNAYELNIIGNLYESVGKNIQFQCKKCGHIFEYNWSDITGLRKIIRCKCKRKYGFSQNEVSDFIKTFYQKPIEINTYKVISPLQLDIYLPEEKIAIEYCGLIWHSDKYDKDSNAHKIKLDRCIEKGIRLITIFEDEWLGKKDVVQNRIRDIIGESRKIFVSECVCREVSIEEAVSFFDKYYLIEYTEGNLAYGLYINDELISAMICQKTLDYTEIYGYCCKDDITVVNGFWEVVSKISGKVLTVCDFRWKSGKSFEKMGFTLTEIISPKGYFFGKETEGKRVELAESNGLNRIYDCGHGKYEFVKI